MNKRKKIMIILIILLLITFVFSVVIVNINKLGDVGVNISSNEKVTFVDSVFEQMLKQSLGKDEIYTSDLDEYSGIKILADRFMLLSGKNKPEESVVLYGIDEYEYKDVRYKDVGTMKSLEDLKYFKNLSNLKVTLQPDIDYSTIQNKDIITILSLTQSKIEDISFLKGFSKLISLTLSSNNIKDISVIKDFTTLKYFTAIENKITNIDQNTIENLKSLKKLTLTYNEISDISGMAYLDNLEYLSLYGNKVKDISSLSSLKNLKELYLNNNLVEDVSPLKDFTSFDALNVTGNPIKNMEVISHLIEE